MMKKYILDLSVSACERINEKYVLLRLTDDQLLPEMLPGQFVEVRVDGSPSTFLGCWWPPSATAHAALDNCRQATS